MTFFLYMGESDIRAEIISKMWTAMREDEENKPKKISVEKQKEYLEQRINSIKHEDRILVGNVVVGNKKKNCLVPIAEGTAIKISELPDDVIDQMYNLVYKIN